MKIKLEVEIDTDNQNDKRAMQELYNIINEFNKDEEDEGYEHDD
jgi:hypothetical protein|tara:strand:- start:204 stop:335 length:132 start_codon:yes stop_codon:yes gene_type:complete